MGSLRVALRSSGRALGRRHHPTIPPPPPNPPATGNPNPGLTPGRWPRSISSLAVEDGPAEATALVAAGEGDDSKKKSGLSTLRSLFARSPTVFPSGAAAVFNPGGVPPRSAGPRLMARPTASADSVTSVEGDSEEEVSPEVSLLIRRLHEEGYLKNPNVFEGVGFGQVLGSGYARGALVAAAQRFAEDRQEIANGCRWLSGSSLKRVALSGCPCTERKTVFAAKRLRSFFCIQEDIVCRGCIKKKSCKFVNQNVNREDKLVLADVMRVLTAYAWDDVTNNPKFPTELNNSVSKSLREVINLSG